jgi:hypothetical protein
MRHDVVISTSLLEQEAGAFSPASFNRTSNLYRPVSVSAPATVRLNPSRTSKTMDRHHADLHGRGARD